MPQFFMQYISEAFRFLADHSGRPLKSTFNKFIASLLKHDTRRKASFFFSL